MSIEDSKIVVVGGSSGIGLGVAEAALARGAQVVIVGRSADRVQEARDHLGSADRLSTHAADVTREDDLVGLFTEVGAFDHLVVTRSTPPVVAPITEFDLDAARQFLDVMLVSALGLVKHAVNTQRLDGSTTFTSGINKDRPCPAAAW